MPVKLIKVGLLKSLLMTLVTPVRVPLTEGVKTTETVQLVPGSREEGQLLLAEKSPVAVMVPKIRLCVVDGFCSVEVSALLVVPTA